jgi:hypothetical protein
LGTASIPLRATSVTVAAAPTTTLRGIMLTWWWTTDAIASTAAAPALSPTATALQGDKRRSERGAVRAHRVRPMHNERPRPAHPSPCVQSAVLFGSFCVEEKLFTPLKRHARTDREKRENICSLRLCWHPDLCKKRERKREMVVMVSEAKGGMGREGKDSRMQRQAVPSHSFPTTTESETRK